MAEVELPNPSELHEHRQHAFSRRVAVTIALYRGRAGGRLALAVLGAALTLPGRRAAAPALPSKGGS